jgi:hypothetical protein
MRRLIYTSGSANGADSSVTPTWVSNQRIWLRIRINGTDGTGYIYPLNDPLGTPIDTITFTPGTSNADNWVGLFVNSATADLTYYWLSAGTNGDTPPLPTAPSLTSASGTTTGTTTADGSITTDVGHGTLYAAVTTSATPPSRAALIAGTGFAYAANQAVTSTGAKSFGATGVTAETTYYWHWVHDTGYGVYSSIVSSASFTTDADGVSGTGSLGSQDSAVSGSGSVESVSIDGSGALEAQASAIAGSGAVTNIVIEDDFERSSINASLSSVTTDTDDVVLVKLWARRQTVTGTGTNVWLEPVGRVTGVNGKRPRFEIEPYETTGGTDRNHQSWLSTQRGHWSYDGETWTAFDTTSRTDDRLLFRHDSAFTEDTVYVARSWPISVAQVGNWVASLASTYSGIISPTPSAAAFTPVDTTGFPAQAYIADEVNSVTDELGRTIPKTPYYAFQIAEGSPPQTAVIVAGIHSGEDVGEVVFRELIDWLCSSDEEAEAIRARFRILVYPLINPAGRYAGYWRGAPGSNRDPNRDFDGTPAHDCTAVTKAVIPADLDGAVPVWGIDIHAARIGETLQLGKRTQLPLTNDWYDYALARYPAGNWGIYPTESANPPFDGGTSNVKGWFISSLGMETPFLVETCERPAPVNPTMMRPYAEAIGGGLFDLLDDGAFDVIGSGALSAQASTVSGAGAIEQVGVVLSNIIATSVTATSVVPRVTVTYS